MKKPFKLIVSKILFKLHAVMRQIQQKHFSKKSPKYRCFYESLTQELNIYNMIICLCIIFNHGIQR